jgi:hypothetical protein
VTGTPADVDGAWSIGGKPHGGYLLRMLAERAVDEAHPHPMAVSAHYVSSPDPGPATIEAERLRTGRRVATTRTRLLQDRLRVEALVTTGRYDASVTPLWTDSAPPQMPPLEECPRSEAEAFPGFRVGHLDFVDVHPDPATTGYARGAPSGRPVVRTWIRMAGGRDTTALDLLVLADALPPITFDLGIAGWVPTVELTVLVRGLPAPGWLVAEQRGRLLQGGWLDEECDVWDSTGRLVCQARQLAGYQEPAQQA